MTDPLDPLDTSGKEDKLDKLALEKEIQEQDKARKEAEEDAKREAEEDKLALEKEVREQDKIKKEAEKEAKKEAEEKKKELKDKWKKEKEKDEDGEELNFKDIIKKVKKIKKKSEKKIYRLSTKEKMLGENYELEEKIDQKIKEVAINRKLFQTKKGKAKKIQKLGLARIDLYNATKKIEQTKPSFNFILSDSIKKGWDSLWIDKQFVDKEVPEILHDINMGLNKESIEKIYDTELTDKNDEKEEVVKAKESNEDLTKQLARFADNNVNTDKSTSLLDYFKKLVKTNSDIFKQIIEIRDDLDDKRQDIGIDLPKKVGQQNVTIINQTDCCEKDENEDNFSLFDFLGDTFRRFRMGGGKGRARGWGWGRGAPKDVPKPPTSPKDVPKPPTSPKDVPKPPNKGVRILKNLTKFARFIPGLGVAIAAGSAAYAAIEGYDNAEDILGREDLTEPEKFIVSGANIISDLSFGFIDTRKTAEVAIDLIKPNKEVNVEELSNEIIVLQEKAKSSRGRQKQSFESQIKEKQDQLDKLLKDQQYWDDLLEQQREINLKDRPDEDYKIVPEISKDNTMINIERVQESGISSTRNFQVIHNTSRSQQVYINNTSSVMNSDYNDVTPNLIFSN